jgi:nicotinate-nucleotide pyrophosphorylase
MKDIINPKTYGLSSRVELRELDSNTIAIVKKRKSRIIMKDGLQLKSMVDKIKAINPELNVSLIVSGPVCSKTIQFFSDQNIELIVEQA